jgi:tRNA-splicing ligase RtcB
MPDVHFGIGATVGSVIPTLKAIIPAAVGVDIGCGMMACKTTLKAEDLHLQQAAAHYATGTVAWEYGDSPLATLRGGFNVARGAQSMLDIAPIVAVRGTARINLFDVVPSFSKAKLLRRDCGRTSSSQAATSERMCTSSWPAGFRRDRGSSDDQRNKNAPAPDWPGAFFIAAEGSSKVHPAHFTLEDRRRRPRHPRPRFLSSEKLAGADG